MPGKLTHHVDPLIYAMIANDYSPNPSGICAGFSFQAIRTFLDDEVENLENILLLLNQVFSDILTDAQSYFNLGSNIANLNNLDVDIKKKLSNFIKEKMLGKLTGLNEKEQENILQLIKNIDTVYANLFDKSTTEIFDLIKLETKEKSDNTEIVGKVENSYSLAELTNCLDSLALFFRALNHRVACVLSCKNIKVNHTIGLGFNPANSEWIIFDTWEDPIFSSLKTSDIAKQIISSLSKNTPHQQLEELTAEFTIEIVARNNDLPKSNDPRCEWLNQIKIWEVKQRISSILKAMYFTHKTEQPEIVKFDSYIQGIFEQFGTKKSADVLEKDLKDKIAFFFDKEAYLYRKELICVSNEILRNLPKNSLHYKELERTINFVSSTNGNLNDLKDKLMYVKQIVRHYENNYFTIIKGFFCVNSTCYSKISKLFDEDNNLKDNDEKLLGLGSYWQ